MPNTLVISNQDKVIAINHWSNLWLLFLKGRWVIIAYRVFHFLLNSHETRWGVRVKDLFFFVAAFAVIMVIDILKKIRNSGKSTDVSRRITIFLERGNISGEKETKLFDHKNEVAGTVASLDHLIGIDDFAFADITDAVKGTFRDAGRGRGQFEHGFKLRGTTYSVDKKKIHPGVSMFRLVLVEIYEVEVKDGDRHDHIVSRGLAKKRTETINKLFGNPFVFVLNLQVPGDPPVSVVCYFAAVVPTSSRTIEQGVDSLDLRDVPNCEEDKFWALFKRFATIPKTESERMRLWEAPDAQPPPSASWIRVSDVTWPSPEEPGALPYNDFRNMTFKIIPHMLQGSWLAKTAVPAKQPFLLGQKLAQRYFAGPSYLEVDVDVASSTLASHVVRLCRASSTSSVVNLAVLVQGNSEEELPEKILGCVCFDKIDFANRVRLDPSAPFTARTPSVALTARDVGVADGEGDESKALLSSDMVSGDWSRALDAGSEDDEDDLMSTSDSASDIYSNSGELSVRSDLWDVEEAKKILNAFEFSDEKDAAKGLYRERGRGEAQFEHGFKVRGPTYLADKMKIHPGESMFRTVLLEIYEVESKDGDRHDHVASRGLASQRVEAINKLPGNPFVFVLNMQIPGDPPVSIVCYMATVVPQCGDLGPGSTKSEEERFWGMLRRFCDLPATDARRRELWEAEEQMRAQRGEGGRWLNVPSDVTWGAPSEPGAYPLSDFKNMRFKLVPNIAEGPWIVRAAVRSTPAILGRKVAQRYFRGPGYIEVDIHVGSSVIASQIVRLCRGYATQFSCDVGVILQAEDQDNELPEKLLGCFALHRVDVDIRQKLD